VPQAPELLRLGMRLRWAVGGSVLISLLTGTAGFAAGTLELASRVDPSQVSDTGAGPQPFEPFLNRLPVPPSLSADGRYAAFVSTMTNLVAGQKEGNGGPGEAGGGGDVFLADLVTGTTTLVSHAMSSPATTGNRRSTEAVLSADGRYVAFASAATDLVPGQSGDPNFPDSDLLLFDRVSGATTLVASSRSDLGSFSDLSISADGRYLVFDSHARDLVPGQQQNGHGSDVFLYDRVEGTTRLVSHVSGSSTAAEDGGSDSCGMSADGRFILFSSNSELVPGQRTPSLFLYDRATEALTLIAPGEVGTISADGKYVVLSSPIYTGLQVYNRETGVTTPLGNVFSTRKAGGSILSMSFSADARYFAFLQTDERPEGTGYIVAVYDRISGTTVTASRPPGAAAVDVDGPVISADGRLVAFASFAPDAVPGQADANGSRDLFLFDRVTGKTSLVSGAGSSPLITGNGTSISPVISANGARIAFASLATDLVADVKDNNEGPDLFAYDVAAKSVQAITRRAPALPSLSPGAESGAGTLSADGRFVAFESLSSHLVPGQVDANGTSDIFLYDRSTKTTLLVSRTRASAVTAASGTSYHPVVSADGRYVAFYSSARNLVPGANPAGAGSLFLFDRTTGAVSLVARTNLVPPPYSPDPAFPDVRMSQDGRWLVFGSAETGLVPGQRDQPEESGITPTVDLFLWDRVTGTIALVSRSAAGSAVTGNASSRNALISADGRYVAFVSEATDLIPGQTGEGPNTFLWDRVTATTTLVSHAPGSALTGAGSESAPDITPDGRFLVFGSEAGGLDPSAPPGTNLYVYDRTLGTVQGVGSSNFFLSRQSRISADGRFVTFVSRGQLVPDIYPFADQVYLYDRIARKTSLITRPSTPNGDASDGDAQGPAISADGRYVAFASEARDLVAGFTVAPDRDEKDLYLYDRIAGTVTLLSHAKTSPLVGIGWTERPVISASGRQVAFTSFADFADGDLNRQPDVYVFSLDPPTPTGPVTLPPCSLFSGPLRSNARKVLKAAGSCGVPAGAKQVAVKITVSQGTGKGNVQLYAGNVTTPAAGILRFERGATRAAAFTLPLSTNGTGTLALLPFVRGNGTVKVSVEVDGYVP
jgi:Tol biopolymer transport system component